MPILIFSPVQIIMGHPILNCPKTESLLNNFTDIRAKREESILTVRKERDYQKKTFHG